MKLSFLISLCVLTLTSSVNAAQARKPGSVEYQCSFSWQTMSEALVEKAETFRDTIDVQMTPTISVNLTVDGDVPKIKVTEKYSDSSKNHLEYTFQCDRFLNCKGKRVSFYEGKSDSEALKALPSGYIGVGVIQGREIFNYTPKSKNNFRYDYVVYKDEKNQPMGLKVDCHE